MDLGLKRFSTAELFTRIFIPTSFLLVCIVHLHYFHDNFLKLTDLKAVTSKQDNTIYRYRKRKNLIFIFSDTWHTRFPLPVPVYSRAALSTHCSYSEFKTKIVILSWSLDRGSLRNHVFHSIHFHYQ